MSLIIIALTVMLYVFNFLKILTGFWLNFATIALLVITIGFAFRSIKNFKLISFALIVLCALGQISLLTIF